MSPASDTQIHGFLTGAIDTAISRRQRSETLAFLRIPLVLRANSTLSFLSGWRLFSSGVSIDAQVSTAWASLLLWLESTSSQSMRPMSGTVLTSDRAVDRPFGDKESGLDYNCS